MPVPEFCVEGVFESLRDKPREATTNDSLTISAAPLSLSCEQITRLITKYKLRIEDSGKIKSGSKTGYAQGVFFVSAYKATSSTKLTSLTWLPARSSSTGIRSRSSLSWASENQLLIGTACCGWKMYEVGELSIMMVSFRSRPICERSWSTCQHKTQWERV